MCFWQDSRYFCSFFSCLLGGAEAKAGLLPPVSFVDTSLLCSRHREAVQRLLSFILRSSCVNSAKLEQNVCNCKEEVITFHLGSHEKMKLQQMNVTMCVHL